MKSITIIGNLGANAIQRMTADGKPLMSFNVAVNAAKDSVIWFNCVGNYRENLFPYLQKGQCVCVVGDLQAGIYNNRIDLSVSVDKVELCGRAPESSQPTETTKEETAPVSTNSSQQLPPDTY